MTYRTARLEVDLAVIPDAVGIAPRPVVALPPSDVDPISDEMRVAVGFSGTMISRAFDPGDEIVTGGPIPLVAMTDEALVAMTNEALVAMVEP